MPIEVAEHIALKELELSDRDTLFALVDRNRSYLRAWLPWLDYNRSPSDTETFLQSIIDQRERGEGLQYGVLYKKNLCGVCGFHKFDKLEAVGTLGYWLSEDCGGRGIMTQAVEQLVAIGFRDLGLKKIEIRCAVDNQKSRAIPERLGFCEEWIRPDAEYLYDHYVDHAIYSMLAEESDRLP